MSQRDSNKEKMMGQKKNMEQEKKARRTRRKMKRYGIGDGFCMDDYREEKRFRRYGLHPQRGYTLVELLITIVVLVLVAGGLISACGCQPRDNGIIILEGYSEAVAFCDGGGEFPPQPLKGDTGTQYRKDGILMVINHGYEHHPANKKLHMVAVEKCKIHFSK